jgi:hypothetical protein
VGVKNNIEKSARLFIEENPADFSLERTVQVLLLLLLQ